MIATLQEKKSRQAGVVFSIIFHALLILLFIWLKFTQPPLESTEEGILINFGNTESGIGEVQPEQINENPQPVILPPNEQPTPQKQEEKVVTQNVEEAPAIENKKVIKEKIKTPRPKIEKKDEKKTEEESKEEPKKVLDRNLLYKGKQNTQSSSEGIKEGKGDQGVITGDPNAKNHEGEKSTGLGETGIGYDLSGRKMLRRPRIEDKSQEQGKVVVIIKVDRNGKTISAKYTQKGSTTTSNYLIGLAEKSAMETLFNPDSNANEEQWGTISFTFKVR